MVISISPGDRQSEDEDGKRSVGYLLGGGCNVRTHEGVYQLDYYLVTVAMVVS
jgi:hypothetical protein